jgi:hypothetical protein
VGAHYLLTMLAEAEPRGLPGTRIERVEFQRAAEGHPLDDVIVHASTAEGLPASLDIQVKRTITFAPSDPVFRDVAEQLSRAIPNMDPSHVRQQFAVATERSSAKITGPYKDVLRWARELGSAKIFFERLARPKVASDDMRTFVETLRKHLQTSGAPGDDETIWQLLRRLSILHFDFAAPGSASSELALERSRNVLHPDEAARASALWSTLSFRALQAAATGGERDRNRLTQELTTEDGFRLSGLQRNRHARQTLAEAAALASKSLKRTIAGASLSRSIQVAAVREATEQGRYIEIRGAPGVGKSGLLGAFLTEVLSEGPAIMLTPSQTPPGGWIGFKSALRVELGPEEFLSDIASDGGAMLFVDSLDSFSDATRRETVIDLVRAAADVPALTVIVTARSDFDRDTPNWLPAEALEKLGRAPAVTLSELSEDEIEELKTATPTLKSLLGADHPARGVARNLFRLSRLLEVEGSADGLRSEADLLNRWWKTGDGPAEGMRDRQRLMAAMADGALEGHDRIETSANAPTIDALVATGTIRELRRDCVTFAHDTLRDWSVASRLDEDPERFGCLPLDRPAPPSLARGIELAGRLAIENSTAGEEWQKILQRVSPPSAHGSWRRLALLAILRSERAVTLLDRASPILFANGGALLKELIRTAIAVESRPMAEFFGGIEGLDLSLAAELYAPANASWFKLARWLIGRRADVPLEALPHVVDLFQGLGTATLFMGPLAAMLADPLADWLEELESARDHSLMRSDDRPRALNVFGYHELLNLSNDVRHTFALMASSVPERAQRYLEQVPSRERFDDIIGDILKIRGTFAKAAPKALADATLKGLIPDDIEEHRGRRRMRDEAFNHLDHELLPSSPAQGPFFELLTTSPEDGLRIVRTLVAHAVTYFFGDEDPGDNQIVIHFDGGTRVFPWANTYNWSRGNHCLYSLESALMALEAWGHQRIERGDPVEDVINDVLGPDGSPAAFVLVAVDLLISHWPKALSAAIPFLGSPELLSLDRMRQAHDEMPEIDVLGLGSLGPKEPPGQVNLASLSARPSRGAALEQLLHLALFRAEADDARLRQLLSDASTRLGPYQPGDTFDVPRFMARYALNALNRSNWHERDGGGFEYVSPDEEREHLSAIHRDRADNVAQFGLEAQIQLALEDKSKSTPDLAVRSAAHAKQLQVDDDEPEDVLKSIRTKIASAALIVVRDGEDSLVASEEGWVRTVFETMLAQRNTDAATSMRNGIRFNPVAIAAVGVGELWRRHGKVEDRDWLLEISSRPDSDALQGVAALLPQMRSADERLIRSVLRVAFASQIRPERDWEADENEGINADRQVRYEQRVSDALVAERAWLNGEAEEPSWPAFPRRARLLRNASRSKFVDDDFEPESDGETFVATQICARWLRLMTRDESSADDRWLAALVAEYEPWTLHANGAGLDASAEINNHLDEWNATFFRIFARTLKGLPEQQAADSVRRVIDVPDESFFEIANDLVPSLDALYFNDQGGSLDLVLKLRSIIADRLVRSDGWRWETRRDDMAVEVHIGPAIGVMFFNHAGSFTGAEAYLKPKGIERLDPFLGQLEALLADGPVPFTSGLTMNLLEVAPSPSQLGFLLRATLIWLKRQPDNMRLWIDHGLGIRVAKWLGGVLDADTWTTSAEGSERALMDDLLARLVRIGVPGAHSLEQKLASARASASSSSQ